MNEFADAALRVITDMRVIESKEPGKLHVSADWPVVSQLWGIPVLIDGSLPPRSIQAKPYCRHFWGYGLIAKVEYGPSDEKGRQPITLTDTQPGPRCLNCGERPTALTRHTNVVHSA